MVYRNSHKSIGVKYNKLTVKSIFNKGDRVCCVAECDCGITKEINLDSIKRGKTKSCGCFLIEKVSTHKLSKNRVYQSWREMRRRCEPGYEKSQYYFNKGIAVCERWKNSFDNFFSDMGFPTTNKHTLDRIDGNKGYYKENCRWATRREQSRNIKSNRMITFNGKTMCLTEWSDICKIPDNTLNYRLKKWGTERALTTPIKTSYQRFKKD